MMQTLLLIIHVLVAIAIIALVLLQHGKGADAGAAFGSGASATMFGSQGATPFLIRFTAFMAAIFFTTSLTLSYMSAHKTRPEDQVLNAVTADQQPSASETATDTSKQNNKQQSKEGSN